MAQAAVDMDKVVNPLRSLMDEIDDFLNEGEPKEAPVANSSGSNDTADDDSIDELLKTFTATEEIQLNFNIDEDLLEMEASSDLVKIAADIAGLSASDDDVVDMQNGEADEVFMSDEDNIWLPVQAAIDVSKGNLGSNGNNCGGGRKAAAAAGTGVLGHGVVCNHRVGKLACAYVLLLSCVAVCNGATQRGHEKVLVEINAILVRHSFDLHEVIAALATAKAEQEIFRGIAKETRITFLQKLRMETANQHFAVTSELESEFIELINAHGGKLDIPEAKIANQQNPVRTRGRLHLEIKRVDRGLFDFMGDIAEAVIGVPSADTQKKTESMIRKLANLDKQVARVMNTIVHSEKEHGDMIQSNQLALINMRQAVQNLTNEANDVGETLEGLTWTMRYTNRMDANLWVLQKKFDEAMSILRAVKRGRVDENLFSAAEADKVFAEVGRAAMHLGGQTIHGDGAKDWLYKTEHVVTTISRGKITQTVRFPVVLFSETMYQQKRPAGSWPPFYLHVPGNRMRLYVEGNVHASKICEQLGQWHICALRGARTYADGAYVVEGEDGAFQYNTGTSKNETLEIKCPGTINAEIIPSTGHFTIAPHCSAEVKAIFAIAKEPALIHGSSNTVRDRLTFQTDEIDELLAKLPTYHRRLEFHKGKNLKHLAEQIHSNHTRLSKAFDESLGDVAIIDNTLQSVASTLFWTKDWTFGLGSVAIIALIIVCVLVVYFCFLARCK